MHTVAPGIRQRHRRQWWALSLCFALLATFLVGWLSIQRAEVVAREGTRLRSQASLLERNLAEQLRSTRQTLIEVSHELRRRQVPDESAGAGAWLNALSHIHAGVRTISVIDADGHLVASNRDDLVGLNVAEREYFQTARGGNDPSTLYLSPPYRTALGVYAMNASSVLQDEQGRFNGLVVATLDPDYFRLLLESVNFAPDMWSAVSHGSGALVMLSPARAGTEGRNLNVPGSMFARHLQSGSDQTVLWGRVMLTGDERVIAQQTVNPPDTPVDQPLVVAISRDASAVLAVWSRLAVGAATMSALVLLVAAGGLRWVQRAERVAAEGLDRLERIGRTAPGVICQLELTADGHAALPFATRSLHSYFGVAVSSEPGSADALFTHIDASHVDAVRNALLESARTLQPFRCEFPIHVPGEPARWLEVHSLPQRRAEGRTLWTGLVMEATAQHAAREAQLALEAAQRASRAKSEFLSRASHELRTPLNAVIGFSSLLLEHSQDPLTHAQRSQVGHILDAGNHLLALINDLLDVSAIESGRVQAVITDVGLATLVAEALSTVQEEASAAGVQLQARVDAPQLAARADRVRLKQVLLNLLSNAIKYNVRGGSVVLSVTGSPAAGAHIEVRDTGEGLSAAQRERLFEPFNRLGADQRGIAGTGIGLTISKMMVELMHGHITVDSAPGHGSRFVVHLPASDTPVDAGAAPLPLAQAPAPATSGPALNVLYAEDNAMNAQLVRQLLALRPAMRLRVASSGADAVRAVRQERPDLLLVDLHLGDISGFELLAQLRADPAQAGLRCAALTADALPSTEQRAAAAGFVDYLTKPLDAQRLLQLLDREALARAAFHSGSEP